MVAVPLSYLQGFNILLLGGAKITLLLRHASELVISARGGCLVAESLVYLQRLEIPPFGCGKMTTRFFKTP
jgi:hypothetical protein